MPKIEATPISISAESGVVLDALPTSGIGLPGAVSDIFDFGANELPPSKERPRYSGEQEVLSENTLESLAASGVKEVSRRWNLPNNDNMRELARDAVSDLLLSHNPEAGPLIPYIRANLSFRIIDHLRKIGLSDTLQTYKREIEAARRELEEEDKGHVSPDDPRIAQKLGIKEDKLDRLNLEIRGRGQPAIQLDETFMLQSRESLGGNWESLEALRRLIEPLSKREQTVLELHYFDGMNQAEIAKLIGRSESVVSILLRDAHRSLRSVLEGAALPGDIVRQHKPFSSAYELRILRDHRHMTAAQVLRETFAHPSLSADTFEPLLGPARSELVGFRHGFSRAGRGILNPYELDLPIRHALRDFYRKNVGTLEGLRRDTHASHLLGVDSHVVSTARMLVDASILDPLLPEGHIPDARNGKLYFNELAVGQEVADLNRRRLVAALFPTLDDVYKSYVVASALGVPNTITDIQRALVDRNMMSRELPPLETKIKSALTTAYLNPEIVGAEWARKNLITYIQRTYKNLDQIGEDAAISHYLKCGRGPRMVAAAVAKENILSSELPANHLLPNGRASFYFDSDIVGGEAVKRNVTAYVKEHFRTLDDVEDNASLALGLGIQGSRELRVTRKDLARALVKQGYINPAVPAQHSTKERRGSFYFDADVVGKEVAKLNLKLFIRERAQTLDDLQPWGEVTVALGLGWSARELARYCVRNHILDWHIPEGHALGKKGRISYYIDRYVMGKAKAQANIRASVEREYPSITDVPKQKSLAAGLRVPYTLGGIREGLKVIGAFSAASAKQPA